MRKKESYEVFTPRQSEVNWDMYVHRSHHEKMLRRWLKETMHGFIFGESGSGKTWLYKNFFSQERINYRVANCTLAASKGSLRSEIFSVCMPGNTSTKKGYSETKDASIGLPGAIGAGVCHEGVYDILQQDALLTAFKQLSKESKGWDGSVIILDNVETIFDSADLMDELADIIVLLDDERYSKHNVKFLIVGVPCGVIEYFSKSKNRSSVGNRITELPSVSGFTIEETTQVVEKGFNTMLDADLSSLVLKGLAGKIHEITLGVPQRVHEYCLSLSYECEDNESWAINKEVLMAADIDWLTKGLRESYAAIEHHFSGNKGQKRRKQVLFTIGQYKGHQFSTSEIGELLRDQFTATEMNSDSGVGSILSRLTKGDSPILMLNKINGTYSFCDPRHIMCLRLILDKKQDESIEKRVFLRH